MSTKGLIDLSRANAPANPKEVALAETTKEEPEVANINAPAAPAVAVVVPPTPVVTPVAVEPVSTIGARIPESLHQNIKLFCIANRIEMQHFVQDALTEHLNRLQNHG